MTDATGNHKLRALTSPITRSMADAGKAKMAEVMARDDGTAVVTDDELVAEVFIAMWCVMQEQAMKARMMAVKGTSAENVLVMPPKSTIIRPV